MKRILLLTILLSTALYVSGWHTPATQASDEAEAKRNYQKTVDFQQEVIPVMESIFKEQFPEKVSINDGEYVDGINSDAFDEITDYYFDNDNPNNPKVVFVVAKEDRDEMKTLRKALEEKLGYKVKFIKAKKGIKEFRNLQDQVSGYLDVIYKGGYSVGYNIKTQTIDVEADLDNQQIQLLTNRFGSDLLSITKTVNLPVTTAARDYPFLNIGGGQEIKPDIDGANTYVLCSSGYIAYKDNQAYMVTAGHCIKKPVAGGSTYEVIEGNSSDGYRTLGYQHWSGYNSTTKYDFGLIRLTDLSMQVTSRFYTNNSGTGAIDGQLQPYLTIGSTGIKVGLAINKSGRTTGITGGTISKTDTTVSYGIESFSVKVLEADLRSGYGKLIDGMYTAVAGSGDSGSTVYRASDYALVGVQSGITTDYTDANNYNYGDNMFVSPAWYANSVLGSTFYQYNKTYDTPVSQMQG
ncbi:trypsin-like serine protease [Paenibacillus sp. PR3]|uniref:Trypsin-like serine protease n=1 Tax=Paenibacillus terricola TaxID=2763503 RepID=A0ABR8N0A7_9BACL|nr:trypsin-like serine protease [Paenibacillus terricola]MBD3920640.1 trypsin-like serine protease [Paenibacillus terricola]